MKALTPYKAPGPRGGRNFRDWNGVDEWGGLGVGWQAHGESPRPNNAPLPERGVSRPRLCSDPEGKREEG